MHLGRWKNVVIGVYAGVALALTGLAGGTVVRVICAQAEDEVYTGTCGENLTWTLNASTGALVISGTGAMTDGEDTEFYEYSDLIKTISISEGVTSIRDYAFYACESLTEVSLPDSVTEIGEYAFEDCGSLSSIVLSSSLKSIGSCAFMYCESLAEVEIPDSVEQIGVYAFYGTPFIQAQTDEFVIFGNGILYSYQGSDTDVVIPDGVTSIGGYAFAYCYMIDRVTLSDSLTTIGYGAFIGCTGLNSMVIGEQVTDIGEYALGYYTSNIGSGIYESYNFKIYGVSGSAAETYAEDNDVTFDVVSYETEKGEELEVLTGTCGENVEWSLDQQKGVLTISGTGEMYNYSSYGLTVPYMTYEEYITDVVIEEGVTVIGSYAFADCSQIKSISIPDSVEEIYSGAFCYCSSLEQIDLSSHVTYLGSDLFVGCSSLKAVNVDEANEVYYSVDGILYDKEQTQLIMVPRNNPTVILRLPETVTSIRESACYGNRYLQTVIFSEGLESIGYNAFGNTSSMKNFLFQGDAPEVSDYELNVTNPHIYAFLSKQGWSELQENLSVSGEAIWTDMDVYGESDVLTIRADQSELNVGDTVQLEAFINPLLATEFRWSSSDRSAAVVSEDGLLMALNPGTVTVTVASADGTYQGQKTFTISGEPFVMPADQVVTLEDGTVQFDYSSDCVEQIPCESLNGIYLLNQTTLSFYSFITKTSREVYSFEGCTDAYAENDQLYVLDEQTCYIYDLLNQSMIQQITLDGYRGNAVGADVQGRIYIAATSTNNSLKHRIFLYSADGTLLSVTGSYSKIYEFGGFDDTNGYFYVEAYYNWLYWGYDHPGKALMVGEVVDDQVVFDDQGAIVAVTGLYGPFLSYQQIYLCQNWYLYHRRSVDLLGGQYVAAASTTFGTLYLMDSHADLNGGMTIGRSAVDYDMDDNDIGSIGVRAVYNDARASLIVYTGDRQLVEYDPTTGTELASFTTQHYVFNLFKMGDTLVIIEKEDGVYYLEFVDWSAPEDIAIIAEKNEMQVGEAQQLTLDSGKSYSVYYEWSSSDSQILSVGNNGRIVAWKEGTAVIFCTSSDGAYSAQYTITVTASDIVSPEVNVVNVQGGTISCNVSENNYSAYGSVVSSYLVENEDGTLTRVEYLDTQKILVETYTKDHALQDSQTLKCELPYFGGFFAGTDYNFLVFGQFNSEQKDTYEVVRVVKYSKDWERLEQSSIYGANTYIPFEAGSLRMTETAGLLYVYTCHEMYDEGDDIHHQSNMTYVISEEDMEVTQSYYDVMNISQTGYVSHSFNQFIQTDGTWVYRVDHGDSSPRAVSITRCAVDGSIEDVSYTLPLSINGYMGDNATGVSVGGFELSTDCCLIVGNSVDQDDEDYSAYGQRNIFLTVTTQTLSSTNVIWLTDYTEEDSVEPRTPQLVKLNDDQFLIMWEEYDQNTELTVVKMVTVDGYGTQTSNIETAKLRLSDCQPIVCSDGLVRWYVTNGVQMRMYCINPYDLSSVKNNLYGDVDEDGDVTEKDLVLIKRYLAGWDVNIDPVSADMDQDGFVNLRDVALLKRYLVGWDV